MAPTRGTTQLGDYMWQLSDRPEVTETAERSPHMLDI